MGRVVGFVHTYFRAPLPPIQSSSVPCVVEHTKLSLPSTPPINRSSKLSNKPRQTKREREREGEIEIEIEIGIGIGIEIGIEIEIENVERKGFGMQRLVDSIGRTK